MTTESREGSGHLVPQQAQLDESIEAPPWRAQVRWGADSHTGTRRTLPPSLALPPPVSSSVAAFPCSLPCTQNSPTPRRQARLACPCAGADRGPQRGRRRAHLADGVHVCACVQQRTHHLKVALPSRPHEGGAAVVLRASTPAVVWRVREGRPLGWAAQGAWVGTNATDCGCGRPPVCRLSGLRIC